MATSISRNKWNGKELHNKSTDVAVSLCYPGKSLEDVILATEPAELRLLYSGTSEVNQLIYGDNLSVLSRLHSDPNIRGKVQLIYIDPPFATGGIFQSRSQKDAYADVMTGAYYIEFLRQRLIFLRELLSDDGSIYLHLDAKMAFHIKVVMDELFGENNFRGWITRKKCNPKNYTRRTYGNISDYILFYTKSDNYFWERPYEQWTDKQALKEYQYVEEETGRRFKKVPIHAPGVRNGATGSQWRDMLPPAGKHWQYTPERLETMDANGEIYWSSNGNPRRKVYLDKSLGKPVQDVWLDFKDAHNQNIKVTGYPTEKNSELLTRIINASSQSGSLVLDCFAGSGTTLAAAEKLERNWIGIDNSPHAIETILKRFAYGTEPMGDFVKKKHSATPSSPTLFDSLAESWGQDQNDHSSHDTNSITDFALLSSEAMTLEFDDILEKWQKSLNQQI